MFIADTHSDTLFNLAKGQKITEVDITPARLTEGGVTLQTFAMWSGPKGPGGDYAALAEAEYAARQQFIDAGVTQVDDPALAKDGKLHFMLSLEGCEVFQDGIEKVAFWRERGIRMGAPVWNNENALAIIYAKNTGEVILRPQQETIGRVTKCKTGRVALVIDKGKSWSKLWYDGHVGYVQNKYLQFIPMAESADDGIVGDKTAPMHLGTHRDTRVVTRVKKGTAVKILWQGDTWAEVAVDGWRGYIQLKYLAE